MHEAGTREREMGRLTVRFAQPDVAGPAPFSRPSLFNRRATFALPDALPQSTIIAAVGTASSHRHAPPPLASLPHARRRAQAPAAMSASPTPSPTLADDASSPSASATAALSSLTSCMQSILARDAAYARCVMNSGLFALNETQPATLPQRLRNVSTTEGLLLAYLRTQLPSSEIDASSVGVCRLQCTAPSFYVSSSCCDATDRLRECQLSDAEATPELVSCKQTLDDSLTYSNQECATLTREDTAFVAVACILVCFVLGVVGFVRWRRRTSKKDPSASSDSHDDDAPLSAWLRQVGVLVWKNMVLRARRPVALVVEQLVPLLFVCALVVLANLDTIFGRNGNPIYRSSDQATDLSSTLICVGLQSITATDLGAPNETMRSFYASGQSVLGLFFVISFIKFVSSMTAAMVHEKEIKMREMMKIMGVSNGALLVSWSATNTVLSLPIVLALSALLKFGNVFPTTPYATVVFVFWSLNVATVAFAYALTPWFHKSRTAAVFSVLLWLLLFFPFFSVEPKVNGEKYGGAFAPPTAFALAIDRLLREAQLGTGFAFSMTAAVQTTAFTGVPTAATMSLFLLLDSVILLILGWYFEQVLPQQFGVRKPWYFLFQRDYWLRSKDKFKLGTTGANQTSVAQSPSLYALASPRGPYLPAASPQPQQSSETPTILTISDPNMAVVEPVSTELAMQEHNGASLQLRSLTKVFKLQDGEDKLAVDKLTLTFYAGQITSLLGHNGAGKTTTISMLTGLIPPSSGDALLFGRSLQRESDAFRRIMGVCPQHDVLFPDLTVDEHLKFFATIKGVRGKANIQETMTSLIEEVGLSGSRNVLSKNLSGGQKRKLSVAIALLGDSKLVFFDEPTSGMDPYSRRFTWNMLRKQREGRVIVLTTHFMDEADVLGDRIAIMADGKLRCVGSSLFLKTRYGAGYNLTMIKANDADFQIADIEAFLRTHIGGGEAELASDSGSEVVFTLPTHTSTKFPALFDALDREMESLCVRNYGISVTTLEDVFLRIAHDRDHDQDDAQPPIVSPASQRSQLSTPSFGSQWATQLRKRLWISKRDKKSLVTAVGIPLLFLIVMAALPTIEVATFLPDYATSFPSQAQQETCPAASITENLLDNRALSWCQVQGFGFCSVGLVDCEASVCCDATDYRSPFYACSTCPQLLPGSNDSQPCYNSMCMRRNGAKLQVALNAFVVAMITMLAFAFVPAAIIAFIVREKDPSQDAKALQWISGLSLDAYWTANHTHDLIVISVSVVVAIITAPIASPRALSGSIEVLGVALLVISHALCVIPMSYLYSRRFVKHASAQTSMLVFALASGGLLSIFSFLCRVVDFNMSSSLTLSGLDRDYLRWFFLLFPGYALNNGIYEIATRKITRGSLYGGGGRRSWNPQASFFGLFRGFGKDPNCTPCWNRDTPGCCVRDTMDFDVALAPIIYMLLEAVVFTVLVFTLEKRALKAKQNRDDIIRTKNKDAERSEETEEEEDEDVVAERERLDHHGDDATTDAIVIRRLRHQYPDGRVALRGLSLAIPKGECFGYLGVNGAGKSTTIKVLTRQVAATSGAVSLAGRDITSRKLTTKGQEHLIGYCPQFDALHDLLTVEEQLILYARIKGVSEDRIMEEVNDKIHQLGLHEYRFKLTRGLSGGNKRKVSTAIALMGGPPIVILDEPSTGMDPSSRRKMWNVIAQTCTTHGTSVVLTTHSMEECEALCSRVGILVRGELKCLGSVQHLRHKYGRGYTVDIKLNGEVPRERTQALESRARVVAGDADVLDEAALRRVCEALGEAKRFEELTAEKDGGSGEWWDAVSEIGVRTMSLTRFAAWWLAHERHEALLRFMVQRFPGTTLVERHGDHVRLHIPKQPTEDAATLRPKVIFEALEGEKQSLDVQEYSVSDTSLEHIFNRMADEDSGVRKRASDAHTSEAE